MKKAFLFLFLFALLSAHAQEWNQDNSQTQVTFKIKNFGVNVDGDFSDVKIQTNFDSDNLSGSYINATIQVISISTGIKKRDEHILEEGYFDEPKHKEIKLSSSTIEKKEDGTYEMTADLTIKETTKKMIIPLEISETDNSITIKSNFQVNRRDFKVGGGSMIMSKKVKIEVQYVGTK